MNYKSKDFEARFRTDSPDGDRLVTLGLLQVIQMQKGFEFVLGIVEMPRSAFEQYNALVVIQRMVFTLSDEQREKLREILVSQKYLIEENKGRWILKTQILQEMGIKLDAAETPDADAK